MLSGEVDQEIRLGATIEHRTERTKLDPHLNKAHVTIIVRHPILSNQLGFFFWDNDLFISVYDWFNLCKILFFQ